MFKDIIKKININNNSLNNISLLLLNCLILFVYLVLYYPKFFNHLLFYKNKLLNQVNIMNLFLILSQQI